jgi:hypothetical protein
MWELEYNEEVKHYFIDNAPYTFMLLVRIEELKYASDAIPPEGLTPVDDEPNVYMWLVLDHVVVFEKLSALNILRILVIKPLD